ncbi:HEPN domain-containing protein [Acidiphilium sp.]|uniref:HEPN domain-containing protein n=1 Tax=Acidiphilium sp. TaxID=527 RepID=UPI0038D12E9F
MAALRTSFVYAKVRTRQLPTAIRDSIFQNCVFQLSATLEDYLYQVTSSWFARLFSGNSANSAIPLMTRALYVARSQEEAFRRFLGLRDESDLATRTYGKINIFDALNDNGQVLISDYDSILLRDRKFPSVDNVSVMFRRIGMQKIFQSLNRRTSTNVELSLRGFMDIRNALAHENPPSITDLDVANYFDQLDLIISAVDREFYKHVTRCSGQQNWPNM